MSFRFIKDSLRLIKKYFFYKNSSTEYSVYILNLLLKFSFFYFLLIWLLSKANFFLPNLDSYVKIIQIYNPSNESGKLESFQHLLLFWNAILVYIISTKQGFSKAIFVAFIWLFLAIDDLIMVHDKLFISFISSIAEGNSNYSFLLLFQQYWEITYWICISIFILIFYLVFLININSKSKDFIYKNFIFFAILGFFGGIIDLINPELFSVLNKKYLFGFIIFIEEFGELISISCAFLFLFEKTMQIQKKSIDNKF